MSEASILVAGDRESLGKAVAVGGGAFVLLYSVFVAQQLLAAVVVLLWLFVVFLGWRFVRAHERLADATERLVAVQTRETSPADDASDSAEQ